MPSNRRSRERKSRSRRGSASKPELVMLAAGAIFFAFAIQAFAVKPYMIPSESMLPTLAVGQRVVVDRLSHRLGADPELGDITVFHPPTGAQEHIRGQCGTSGQGPSYAQGEHGARSCSRPTSRPAKTTYIKRVVGMPGDRIEVRDGRVIRNGAPTKEPFAAGCGEPVCNLGEIVIPRGAYFLMGDNRDDSNDSRYWGPVPRAWIIGKAVATYWPPGRVGAP